MRRGRITWLLLVATVAPLAGCAEAPVTNPNLHAPKLVLDRTVDNMTELYIHSAFGERAYDQITIALDNETLGQRSFGYSLDLTTPATRFFLTATVRSGESRFAWNGMVDLDVDRDRVSIAPWLEKKNVTEEPRTFALPFEMILDKARVTS
ncbi:MAG TPA: hypothetical protein VM889_02740 [Candidatus Thermoplasmatota archaeon]|nr:hypothetical protein [Candidatus Thermoplasmatota archaeon]